MKPRTGILGGAFNPPHQAHLKLAELALAQLRLDEVLFIPTAGSPHKPTQGPGGAQRLALLQAALADSPLPFRADDLELRRGGTSYTVDTLEDLSDRRPGRSWILLLGSDQLPGLPRWRRAERVLELASLAISPRPGSERELPAELRPRLRPAWSGAPGEVVWLPGTELPLASTELRSLLSAGGRPEGLPDQVLAAILRENLYR